MILFTLLIGIILSAFAIGKAKWPVWSIIPVILGTFLIAFVVKKLFWLIFLAVCIGATIYFVGDSLTPSPRK